MPCALPTTDATPEDPPAPSFEQVKTAPPRPQHPHPSDEPYTPKKRGPDEVKQTIDDVFQTYDPFLDRLKNGSLLSEEFKLGGEMSSVFARDLIGMDKDETDLSAKHKFSARVSLLSGASGTGKTQTCARLLGNFCGLGISCRPPELGKDPTDPGFRSCSGILNSLADRSKFGPISGDTAQLGENRTIVRTCVLTSVLSRISVLEAFLKCKPDAVSVETWKMQWALFELHPELSYKDFPELYQDICERLEDDLRDASPSAIWAILRATMHRLKSNFSEYMKIFYLIIDEAQFGALEYTSHFRSRADPDRPRSFLTEVVNVLTGFGLFTHTVISGISLSEDQIIDSVQSTTARLGTRLKVVYIPDGFYDKEEQRKYILKHLGPWAEKRKIPVKSFKRLVQRMLDLFPGRYRVTACFIEIVLRSDTECPHRLFTLFALRLTGGYVCTDGGQIEREEACLEGKAIELANEIRPIIDWKEYDSLPPDVKTTVIHMVARYITTGTMSTVTDKELKLVKASIGHVRCEETYDGSTDKVGSTGLGATGKGTTGKGTTGKGTTGNGTTGNGSADDGSTDKSSAHKSESRGADGQKAFVVSITEPLVIFSLMIRCKDELIKAVGDSTRWAPEPCSQGRSYELQILVIIALMFGGQFRRLGDLLLFREKYKHLEDLECELVAIYKVDGEYVASSAGWGCGPSSSLPLGFRANKAPDLKETVERGVGAAFYLPDPNNHIDVEFYARPKGSSKIIRIHVQAKFTTGENGKIRSVTFREAKQSLDPEWIYMSRCNKPGEPDRKLSTEEGPAIMEIFEKMRLAKHGDYEPLVPLSAEEEAKIPDHISVIAIAGPEETPKHFWKCEEDVWGPLSVTQSWPFKRYFGATWALAGAQNMVRVPEPRAT
ncbi:uncharacterized protein STEHIDRAFT_163439 [Stereum hirsutum FP-91666 SS1]|uniref:Uncharacterized protein n=1 Tax=Stereum hirsutum (strain FP-91666) TaxID=721885 RepID=R7RZ69_STEHR|nr:uncharacterized protein STEHIDRAFT_163439 [Stereum hirsutum FP-91666 SS1]EIM79612.1 hypothetical protein STEHIDRAFT_163439 [Stereum hirsutum FP-91666 SS1]